MKIRSLIINHKSSLRFLFSPAGTILFITLNFALFLLFWTRTIDAETMSNSNYTIHFGNLNTAAGNASNSNYGLGITVGQIAPGLYTGANYTVKAGFQYVNSRIAFAFSISSLFIDFGVLAPGTPVTRTNNLTVSNGSSAGYQVLVNENHPLRVLGTGIDIPDTTCDSGTCTHTTSAAWTSPLTYGFGYRCDNVSGTDCSTDFATSTFYKQFASSESAELSQNVMSSTTAGRNRQVQITYKANVSSTQASGQYLNNIMYIAIPSI